MLLSRMSVQVGVGTIEYNPLIDCRYSVDQLKKEYDKAYYAISLHSAENLPEIKAERESMSHSLQYLMSDNIKKESEIQQLNAKLEKIERIQSDMQKITQALKDRGELDN